MSEKPDISICIPTCNGGKFIAETIESVLNQTHHNFELIVSDDGSTDETLEIVRSFTDPRITRVDSLSKVGAVANWNNSIRHARADLVKLLCQDDLLYPNCIKSECEVMQKPENQDVSFCFSLRDFVGPRGRKVVGRRVSKSDGHKYTQRELLRKIVRSGGNPIGEPMSITFRKQTQQLCGDFRGDYVIDLDMWSRLVEHGPALFVGKRLSAFRVSKTSWTASLTKSQATTVRNLSKKILAEKPSFVRRADLLVGYLVGLFRAPIRRVFSSLILFGDKFFGSAGQPRTSNDDQHADQ